MLEERLVSKKTVTSPTLTTTPDTLTVARNSGATAMGMAHRPIRSTPRPSSLSLSGSYPATGPFFWRMVSRRYTLARRSRSRNGPDRCSSRWQDLWHEFDICLYGTRPSGTAVTDSATLAIGPNTLP